LGVWNSHSGGWFGGQNSGVLVVNGDPNPNTS
jgi:hypothetical protein